MLRRAISASLSLLPVTAQSTLLAFLARRRNIAFLVAEGAHGSFEGSLKDNVIFGEYLRTRNYAEHIIALFQDFFSHAGGGTFIDIGANIGLVSIPVSRTPAVKCIALEPEPVNYGCLVRNIQRNAREDQVGPLNKAVYKERASIAFELSETNWGDHRIRIGNIQGQERYGESGRRTIEVEAVPLDELVPAGSAKPIAIKIDIQGAEASAFLGGQSILSQTDLMVSEFWPYAIVRAGSSAEDFLNALEPHFAFGITIGHRTAATGLLDQLRDQPLKPFAELRTELLRHAGETPDAYTDILLAKANDLFLRKP